jgi:uncharacterized protein YukE
MKKIIYAVVVILSLSSIAFALSSSGLLQGSFGRIAQVDESTMKNPKDEQTLAYSPEEEKMTENEQAVEEILDDINVPESNVGPELISLPTDEDTAEYAEEAGELKDEIASKAATTAAVFQEASSAASSGDETTYNSKVTELENTVDEILTNLSSIQDLYEQTNSAYLVYLGYTETISETMETNNAELSGAETRLENAINAENAARNIFFDEFDYYESNSSGSPEWKCYNNDSNNSHTEYTFTISDDCQNAVNTWRATEETLEEAEENYNSELAQAAASNASYEELSEILEGISENKETISNYSSQAESNASQASTDLSDANNLTVAQSVSGDDYKQIPSATFDSGTVEDSKETDDSEPDPKPVVDSKTDPEPTMETASCLIASAQQTNATETSTEVLYRFRVTNNTWTGNIVIQTDGDGIIYAGNKEGSPVAISPTVEQIGTVADNGTVNMELEITYREGATGDTITFFIDREDEEECLRTTTITLQDTIVTDTDGDGLSDTDEATYGTDINDSDSDNDELSDYDEVTTHLTDPTLSDTDGDGLSDYDEVITYLTDPLLEDTDADGYTDYEELTAGTDPLDATNYPTTEEEIDPRQSSIPCSDPFVDTRGHWAQEVICKAYHAGIVNGKSYNMFEPETYVTRAEFLKMLVKSAGYDEHNANGLSETFEDVDDSDWYSWVIKVAENLDVARSRDSGGFFNGESLSTRADSTLLAVRMAGEQLWGWGEADIPFTDVHSTDYFAYAVIIAYRKDILTLPADKLFNPYRYLTRAEAIAITTRAWQAWYRDMMIP